MGDVLLFPGALSAPPIQPKRVTRKLTTPLTPAMNEVVQWLFNHPGLRISWTGAKSSRPMFTSWWASEAARTHMIDTFRKLDAAGLCSDHGVKEKTEARHGRNQGGTPPLTRPTFFGLLDRGMIRAVEKRLPIKGMTEMYYYQLTAKGKQLATGLQVLTCANVE